MKESVDAQVATPTHDGTQSGRVKKRTSNACKRCKQQKTKCSGTKPCGQCSKRSLPCIWDEKQPKVLISRSFLAELQHRAALNPKENGGIFPTHVSSTLSGTTQPPMLPISSPITGDNIQEDTSYDDASRLGIELDPDTDSQSGFGANEQDEPVVNPLFHGSSGYTTDVRGRPSYLGTSSNWAFARRILMMAHAKVSQDPLPSGNLIFEGATYQLGWNGQRKVELAPSIALPTTDFAMYLINTVKFHSQLFHLFDQDTFMEAFGRYHGKDEDARDVDVLWLTHYHLILALGKAFVGRSGSSKRPPGADFFTQGMRMLPDITFLCANALQSMEVLCCAGLYLQCLDMRAAAYNLIGQALRIAFAGGLHTDMLCGSYQRDPSTLERCRQIWWTIYVLDCHMTALMGTPSTVSEHSISTGLPTLGPVQKSQALKLHVRLANTIAMSLSTVYARSGPSVVLNSVRTVLRRLAEMSDERTNAFPLNLTENSSSISRLSAHLHLFHHQCIILTTRPLLFSFWSRRLESAKAVRVSSAGGVRSLMRVCIGSAKQILKILIALQDQDLLEAFMPFDLEAVWSAAIVLLITKAIDPTLLRGGSDLHQQVYNVLGEMASRGNLIAEARRSELQQLEYTLERVAQQPSIQTPTQPLPFNDLPLELEVTNSHCSGDSHLDMDDFQRWTSDGISGNQLEALANSLDFDNLDWFAAEPATSLYH